MHFDEVCVKSLIVCADFGVDGCAVFKEDDGRDAGDAVFGGDFLRFVNVDLRDDGLALVFFCNFLNERCDQFSLAAPGFKKVYKNKLVIADQCAEIFSCGMYDCHGNFLLKMIWHYTEFV